MNKSNFVWRTLGIAGIAAVFLYFIGSIAGYLLDPLTTAVAYNYHSEDSITVSGYLVRDEGVLADNPGLVYITRDEGERVSKGRSVAVVYHSQEALDQAEQLEDLRIQLEQLEYAQSVATGSQEALKLDSSIMDSIYAIRQNMNSEQYTNAEKEAATLRTLILKRDYTYSGEGDIEGQIESLTTQIRSLSSATRSGSTAVTVSRGGYYSSLVDGYETVLTPASLETMTPSILRDIQPDATLTSSVGKMIYGNSWYYVTAMATEDAALMSEGSAVTLRFVSGLDQDVPMTVERISADDHGQTLVVLRADQYISVTTLLRDQNAQVIFRSYDGIRVPQESLRVWKRTVTDEDGNESTESLVGVYCRIGMEAQFKPVSVVYQGEDYYLVAANPSAKGSSLSEKQVDLYTLRAGDEVIVTAKDLYNGKVIG